MGAKALRCEKVQHVQRIEETLLAAMKLARQSNIRSLTSRMTKYFVTQTRMLSTLNYTKGKGELLINMLRQDINCNYPRAH